MARSKCANTSRPIGNTNPMLSICLLLAHKLEDRTGFKVIFTYKVHKTWLSIKKCIGRLFHFQQSQPEEEFLRAKPLLHWNKGNPYTIIGTNCFESGDTMKN